MLLAVVFAVADQWFFWLGPALVAAIAIDERGFRFGVAIGVAIFLMFGVIDPENVPRRQSAVLYEALVLILTGLAAAASVVICRVFVLEFQKWQYEQGASLRQANEERIALLAENRRLVAEAEKRRIADWERENNA